MVSEGNMSVPVDVLRFVRLLLTRVCNYIQCTSIARFLVQAGANGLHSKYTQGWGSLCSGVGLIDLDVLEGGSLCWGGGGGS